MRTPAGALSRIVEVLDRMSIPYAIGGSVASSTHGIPRTTLNVDLIVDMPNAKVDEFANSLAGEFYADITLISDSFAAARAANLIHFATAWKFDLFPLQSDEYSRIEISRRIRRAISPDGTEAIDCTIASAEDTVLRKLEWYRAGGHSSERQWNDLPGVCRTMGAKLDREYMRQWAAHLNLTDLLEALLIESAF